MGNAGIKRIASIRKLPGASINSANYLIRAGGRKYVLKQDLSTPRKRLELTAQVLSFCSRKWARVPELLAAKDRYLLFRFVKGRPFAGTSKEMLSLARELVRLHKALAKCRIPYPAKRVNARLYKPLSPSELKRMKRMPSFDTLFRVSTLLTRYKLSSGPRQLIHGDLQPGNVLFEKGRVTVILDFGGMHKENPWREVAFAAFRFTLTSRPHASREAMKKEVVRFANIYAKARGARTPSFEELRLHFLAETFARVSYILRQLRETGSSHWLRDLPKQITFLRRVLALESI